MFNLASEAKVSGPAAAVHVLARLVNDNVWP